MKKIICKTKMVNVSNDIVEVYQLARENGAHTIKCFEINLITDKMSVESVTNIKAPKEKIEKIFDLLVKFGACQGTIKDIIEDQLC